MERGYVRLWRRTIDSAVFADPVLFKLWTLCLMKATHKERHVSIDGISEPIKLCPGQFVTGRFQLHKEYYPRKKKNNFSPLTLWRKLEILKNLQNLNIKTYNKYSIITINNWDQYQQNEQQLNNSRTTAEQQLNTNKNVLNSINNKKTTSGNGRFKPPSLREVTDYCLERNNGIDPEAFISHYESVGWFRGKTKIKNWKQCVITWEKKRREDQPVTEVDPELEEWRRKYGHKLNQNATLSNK